MTLPQNPRLLWGAVASHENIGAGTIRRFLKNGWSSEDVWRASYRQLREIGAGEELIQRFPAWRERFSFGRFEQTLERDEIRIVLHGDDEYPLVLDTIHNAPEVLFVRGVLPPPKPSVAVVGSRGPSDYGKGILRGLIDPVAQAGIPIISGLAMGTDGNAHIAALDANGYTCAVLGSGVDRKSVYPSCNKYLAERIIEHGGGVISEFPPGTRPRPENFPIRNRIIAGLVNAVVVIEATLESGTMITAKEALEENREVLAVPGSILSAKSAGTHKLIQGGARLCTSAQDIFDALQLDRVETCTKAQAELPLTSDERSLFERLACPYSADELSRLIDWSIGRVNHALTLLELRQLVTRAGSQQWARV